MTYGIFWTSLERALKLHFTEWRQYQIYMQHIQEKEGEEKEKNPFSSASTVSNGKQAVLFDSIRYNFIPMAIMFSHFKLLLYSDYASCQKKSSDADNVKKRRKNHHLTERVKTKGFVIAILKLKVSFPHLQNQFLLFSINLCLWLWMIAEAFFFKKILLN